MKKIIVFVLLTVVCSAGFTSKLSKFLNKMDAEQKQRDAQEWQQDMNFGDYAFRLKERYVDDRGNVAVITNSEDAPTPIDMVILLCVMSVDLAENTLSVY